MIRILALMAAFLLLDPIARADTAEIGPTIGTAAPVTSLRGPSGNELFLDSVAGEKGTILVFFRSAEWCPFCKKQLEQLQAVDTDLRRIGWQLVGISYDDTTVLRRFAAETGLTYPLLSDPDSETIKAYGLLNDEVNPASRAYGIPHPAIIFISEEGTISRVLREEGYKERPASDVVLETAKELTS